MAGPDLQDRPAQLELLARQDRQGQPDSALLALTAKMGSRAFAAQQAQQARSVRQVRSGSASQAMTEKTA
jgi:hypothetical protein